MQVLLVAAALACQAAPAGAQLLEPIALPAAVEQGVDMVYVDREIGVDIRWRNTKLDDVTFARYAGAPLDLLQASTLSTRICAVASSPTRSSGAAYRSSRSPRG